MFGSKKFQKGMEAGARPFAAKFEQYSGELKRLESKFGEQWKESKDVADEIINNVEENERARLYGLNAQIDIKQLKKEYKDFIVAALYALSPETNSEFQQSYIRSVQKYLGIKTPQTSIDFSSLENVEDLKAQKAIFQVCVEYLFLANNNPDFFEQYEETLFIYFSLNDKAKVNIWENILRIFSVTGPLGLAEKYGFVPKAAEGKGGAGVYEPVELEDEIIVKDIHIPSGKGKKFHAKNIRLNADIHCEGELVFDNCVITYNGDDINGHILMKNAASLSMSHCTFVGMNNEKRNGNSDDYLIEGSYPTSKLFIEGCLFLDCLSFAKKMETQLTNSIIRYTKLPTQNQNTHLFDCVYESDSRASNCIIESLEADDDMAALIYINYVGGSLNMEEALIKYFKINSMEKIVRILLERYKLDTWNEFKEQYYFGDFQHPNHLFKRMKIFSGCSFKNIAGCLSSETESVTYCQFSNCIRIMEDMPSNKNCDITYCTFNNCYDILSNYYYIDIKNCTFLNCFGSIVYPGISKGKVNIFSCQFYQINGGYITAGEGSKISQCLFDGITVPQEKNFISTESRIVGISLTVEDCEFKHCIKKHSNFEIIECDQYTNTGFLGNKRKYFTSVGVRNCRGLENVNKEGELTGEVTIKYETSTGKPIGARLDEATVGVPGYTPDSAERD